MRPPVALMAGHARSAIAVYALAVVVVTAVLTAGAAAGALGLLVAVGAVQGLFVLTWALTCGPPRPSTLSHRADTTAPSADDELGRDPGAAVPGRIGTALVGAAAAAGADIAASVRPHDALAPMLVVLGLTIPAMFIHQLTRGVVRGYVVESVSGIAVVVVAVVALSALLQLRHEFDGARMTEAAVVVAGVAVALAYLVDLVWSRPRFDPQVPRGLTGVVVGIAGATAAGVLVLRALTQYGNLIAALLCGIIAAVAALVSVSASMISAGIAVGTARAVPGGVVERLRPVALAILPLALVAPVAYLLLLVR